MELIIKSLAGEISEDEKKIVRKSMLWFDKHLPNNSVMTVGIKQHITKKSNQAYEVITHVNTAQLKKPVYVKVFRNSLVEAINISREKIERIVVKTKEQRKLKFKLPSIKFSKKAADGKVS